MFIKIENYYENKPLILNGQNIIAIDFCFGKPTVIMSDNHKYFLSDKQYTEFCEFLKRFS